MNKNQINTVFLTSNMLFAMKPFLYIIVVLCLGCKNNPNPTPKKTTPIAKLDSLSQEKITIEMLSLSAEAEKSLENFEDFHKLRDFITQMRNGNAFFVNKHADSIDIIIKTFKENLSEDLNINPINSRISILATESGLLKLYSEKKHQDSVKIMKGNTQLIKAYNSLVIQLNELSLAIPETIEKELLKDLEKPEKQSL